MAEGKVVFVDVTADWCANCKVNDALVLERPEVALALAGPGVVAMRADWTRSDARISDYLARNDRFGIPFNARVPSSAYQPVEKAVGQPSGSGAMLTATAAV